MQNNSIREVRGDVFRDLAGLTRLSLEQNALSRLPENVLAGLSRLRQLTLDENRIAELPSSLFSGLTTLRALGLSRNRLTDLPRGVFAGLGSLEEVCLQDNPAPFAFPVELRRADAGNTSSDSVAVSVGIDVGAPFQITVSLRARGGTLSTQEVTLSPGDTLSTVVTMATESASDSASFVTVTAVPTPPPTGLCGPPGYSLVRGEPLVVVNPVAVSVSVRAAHLTQATQSIDGGVPLVAGRDALLRVFVTADGVNSFRPGARAIFFFGPGSRTDTVSLSAARSGVPTGEPDEGSLSKSFNAWVRGSVLAPGTEMVVELDGEGVPLKSGSVTRLPGAGRSRLDVRSVPPLHMTVVPVQWLSETNASTNAEVMDFARDMVTADLRGTTRLMRTVMPIAELRLKVREPYFTWGNRMEIGVSDLLNELEMLRHLEATREDEYYHGLFRSPRDRPAGSRWSGLANSPGFVAASWLQPRTIAHELGHNLSLGHAPCGDPLGLDPRFPYTDGSIGAWGHRPNDGNGPEFGWLYSPVVYKDLMTYCGPEWVSDYNFRKALEHRLSIAQAADPTTAVGQTLLLWGGVEEGGQLTIEPAFVHDARVKLPEAPGPYTLTGLDSQGRELFAIRFSPDMRDHGGSSFLFAIPYDAAWEAALDRVTLKGPQGSTYLDRGAGGRAALIIDRSTLRVRSIVRDWPGTLPVAMVAETGFDLTIVPGLPRR